MELNNLSIKEALEGLKKKSFSAKELVEACLKRINKIDKTLNAFITVSEKEAFEKAGEMDNKISKEKNPLEEFPLLGIPVALKDLYSTKGVKTTAGSKVLENYIPAYDATVVKKLKGAGAIIIGKTNCDAWAHGASGEHSDFGPTKNPYDLERVPGGSSSGSATSVISGECLSAMGTDTGGSIRLPASYCNVVGIKPTYGRVSRYGIVAMASSLDSIGHLSKTVYDNALILNVTAGKDDLDATTSDKEKTDYTKNIKTGIKGLTVGIPKEYFVNGADKKVEERVREAIKVMEKLGAKVSEVSLPHTKYAIPVYYIIQSSEVSSNLARYDGIRLGNGRETFGDEAKRRIMLGTYTLSAGYYEAYYLKAMKVRTLIRKDFDEVFKKVDVLIAPVSPHLPFKIGEKTNDPLQMYLEDVLTAPINLSGIPGLALPCGFVDSLPVGMQILGPHFSEELLYKVGYAYEQETQWYKIKPKIK